MKNGQSVSGIANRLSTLRELGGRRKDTAQSICAATGMTAAEYDKSIFALREWIIKTEAAYAPGEKDVAPLREKCITQITPDLPCGIVRAAAYCDDAQTIARLGVLWAAFKNSTEHANAITVPDFSDSMLQTSDSGVRPIDIAASLAIFTAQTCNGHFANKFITFSGAPKTIELRGKDLAEKAEYCTAHKSSERLRLCDVLLTILEEAVAAELPEEELPRFVYVVSDMALEAGTAFGERLMENALKLYKAHGYTLPEIIYWNVDGKEDTFGARLDANGIIQVRGASDTLIRKVFNHRISLKSIMRSILTSSRYRASDRCA
jgi:hypothetical protein